MNKTWQLLKFWKPTFQPKEKKKRRPCWNLTALSVSIPIYNYSYSHPYSESDGGSREDHPSIYRNKPHPPTISCFSKASSYISITFFFPWFIFLFLFLFFSFSLDIYFSYFKLYALFFLFHCYDTYICLVAWEYLKIEEETLVLQLLDLLTILKMSTLKF